MKKIINNIGKIVALISFIIGTIFLSFYLYFGESTLNEALVLGFIIIAFIVNLIIIIVVIRVFIFNPKQRIEVFKTIALMLINIPVAILYFYMVITFPGHKFIL